MTSKNPDTESERPTLVRAKLRLRVERASVPTLGELEGLKLVVVTDSGGRLAKAILVLLALALWHFGVVPAPW
ncbi:hypothetical protein [Halorussus sp. MSC15.2]|uniref:hypothetical protein n=1 Tax=Halorussus sp. MSC15.2 TaxID=2283638 RepID=UPI0013D0BC86|nr:hypothetical protein [Halorussus sp. MSC15.2]NEU56518.1 hypothetical protein [Halorussus sp. MSC15.2]